MTNVSNDSSSASADWADDSTWTEDVNGQLCSEDRICKNGEGGGERKEAVGTIGTRGQVVIGTIYLLITCTISLINIPCLYAMYHEKDLWKNSCIKVIYDYFILEYSHAPFSS